MKLPHLLPFLALLAITSPAFSQSESREIFGRVFDANSMDPISSVHVFTHQTGAHSDHEGNFKLKVRENDTIRFTHINYSSHFMLEGFVQKDSLVVFLIQKEILLNEVIIREMPTEEEFKRRLLDTKVEPSREKMHAEANIDNARRLYLSGYSPDMNSEDNYKVYIQGPQGVSILSSHPSKGLLKAFKNIASYHKLVNSKSTISSPFVRDSVHISEDSLKRTFTPDTTELEK